MYAQPQRIDMNKNIQVVTKYDQQAIDEQLSDILQQMKENSLSNWIDRLNFLTQKFLNIRYVFDCVGEGINGQYDQSPLFRFDCFDCVTYINTLLALGFAEDAQHFQQLYQSISYCSSEPYYESRSGRFWCTDWNDHNSKHQRVSNITSEFKDANHQVMAKIAYAEINRAAWFKKREYSDIKLLDKLSMVEAVARLAALQALGEQFPPQQSQLSYLPIEQIINAKGKFFPWFIQQMPEVAIVEIVRPNWDLHEKIGTNLNVSHVGFSFRCDNQILFRHASSLKGKVVEIALDQYLVERSLMNSEIKGIHILKIEKLIA